MHRLTATMISPSVLLPVEARFFSRRNVCGIYSSSSLLPSAFNAARCSALRVEPYFNENDAIFAVFNSPLVYQVDENCAMKREWHCFELFKQVVCLDQSDGQIRKKIEAMCVKSISLKRFRVLFYWIVYRTKSLKMFRYTQRYLCRIVRSLRIVRFSRNR